VNISDSARNKQLLKDTADDHGLSTARIAALCRVSPETARAWLKPATSSSARYPTATAVDLLYLRLGLASPFGS